MVTRELWKGMAVPKIMYGAEVLGLKKNDLNQLDRIQNQIARFALGVPSYTATEALRGEMGWSLFSERHEKGLLKLGGRIELMNKDRMLRRVIKSREGYK